ncbi:MAG: hypothetical protein HZB23_09250 [Deltaproteobacteria bacterium]|nr:hypothetical protein [Deltaproteobacteria bacterium]
MAMRLLRGDQPPTQQDYVQLGKTLLIGLGGTGKEVLLRFRRLVVEKFGSLDALPCIQYICIDTDNTEDARKEYDRTILDDPLYRKIKFNNVERVDLALPGGIGNYIKNINNYPHIKTWLNTQGNLADLGDLGKGAGQVRMASRLAFYHHFDTIVGALQKAEGALADPNVGKTLEGQGLGEDYNPNLKDAYIICSLGGGTGAGVFLDTAYLVAQMYSDYHRTGMLFLPSFFTGYSGSKRIMANGYAALKELNHYSFANRFILPTRQNPANMGPPPFNETYLLESQNEVGEGVGTAGKEYAMYQMVAEILAQIFSQGAFSGKQRAIRVNLQNFVNDVFLHTVAGSDGSQVAVGEEESYSTRFCSFGMSSISFPTDRLHWAASCRMAQDILDIWQKEQHGDILKVLFTDFLSEAPVVFAQGTYTRPDTRERKVWNQLNDELLMYERSNAERFPAYVWRECLSLRSKLDSAPYGQKSGILNAALRDWDLKLAGEGEADRKKWGQDLRRLEDNLSIYADKVKEGIRARALALQDDNEKGVAYVLDILRELKSLLKNPNYGYLPYYVAEEPRQDANIQQANSRLSALIDDLGRVEKDIFHKKEKTAVCLGKLVTRDSRDPGHLYNYVMARVMRQAAKRGQRLCEEIDRFLGVDAIVEKDSPNYGLIAEYRTVFADLDELKANLKKREDYFISSREYGNHRDLYREGDVDAWYDRWMGEGEARKARLVSTGASMLDAVFHAESVPHALNYIRQTSLETIEDQVTGFCHAIFKSHPVQPSALDMFFDDKRVSDAERKSIIQTMYRRARPWLRQSDKIGHALFSVGNDQKPCLIGLDTESSPVRTEQFRKLLSGVVHPGDPPHAFINIGTPKKGAIVFYNELAGVTAFYPTSVTQTLGMKECYEAFWKNPDEPGFGRSADLHTDKNRFKFSDIIPKTDEEVRKNIEGVRDFMRAWLLGILSVTDGGDEKNHSHYNQFGYIIMNGPWEKKISLGSENHSLDIIYGDRRPAHETHRQVLLGQVEEALGMVQTKGWLPAYLLLIDFFKTHFYPPKQVDCGIEGQPPLTRYSLQYLVLENEENRVLDEFTPSREEKERLSREFLALRGKPTAQALTFEEYEEALRPFTRPAGKFLAHIRTSAGVGKMYRSMPALDLKAEEPDAAWPSAPKAEPVQAATSAVAQNPEMAHAPEKAASPAPSADVATRPCPSCGKPIPASSIFCRFEKKIVAEHVKCMACGAETPNDARECAKCGGNAWVEDVECPMCKNMGAGFPCHVCGYEPEEEAANVGSVDSRPADAPGADASDAPTSAGGTDALQEDPKDRCPVCQNPLSPGQAVCPACGTVI